MVKQTNQNSSKSKARCRFNLTVPKTLLFFGISALLYFGIFGINKYFLKQSSSLQEDSSSKYYNKDQQSPALELTVDTQVLNSLGTELLFVEKGKSVYRAKNNRIEKLFDSPMGRIMGIFLLPNNKKKDNLIVVTGKPKFFTPWLYNEGTNKVEKAQCASKSQCTPFYTKRMTRFEVIYTKETPTGSADILLDKFDGNPPVKIGFIKDKSLKKPICESGGEDCYMRYFPKDFVASFDGSFILNVPQGGGGLGEPALVISRDGSNLYKIPFYWYVSNAVWIDNNRLLTQDGGNVNIFTFNTNGTFTKSPVSVKGFFFGSFNQKAVSPNRKYLGAVFGGNSPGKIVLFDLTSFDKKVIETLENQDVSSSDSYIAGWNKDSTKMLYVLKYKAKIYDLKSGKSSTVAYLNNVNHKWSAILENTLLIK